MAQDITGLMQTVGDLELIRFYGVPEWRSPLLAQLMALTRYSRDTIVDWQSRFFLLRTILIVVWLFNIFHWLFLQNLLRGVCVPRSPVGLFGIALAPLIHADIHHLFGNSLFFFVYGWLILLRGVPDFLIVTAVIWLTRGIGVWLFKQGQSYGASGIVYGYASFLLLSSFLDRDVISLLLTVVVLIVDRTVVQSAFRVGGVSWEGHVFGFFGGILAALWLPGLKLALLA